MYIAQMMHATDNTKKPEPFSEIYSDLASWMGLDENSINSEGYSGSSGMMENLINARLALEQEKAEELEDDSKDDG